MSYQTLEKKYIELIIACVSRKERYSDKRFESLGHKFAKAKLSVHHIFDIHHKALSKIKPGHHNSSLQEASNALKACMNGFDDSKSNKLSENIEMPYKAAIFCLNILPFPACFIDSKNQVKTYNKLWKKHFKISSSHSNKKDLFCDFFEKTTVEIDKIKAEISLINQSKKKKAQITIQESIHKKERWAHLKIQKTDFGSLLIIEDITLYINVWRDLKNFERRYYTFVNGIPHGVSEVDKNGKIKFANKARHDMLGRPYGSLIGKNIWELHADETNQQYTKELFQKIIKKEVVTSPITREYIRSDGQKINVEICWNYLYDIDDKLNGIISFTTNVTEREKALKALSQSQERLSLALRGTQDGLWDWDLKTDKIYCTARTMEFFGYQPKAQNILRNHWINHVFEDDQKDVEKALTQFLTSQTPVFNRPFRILRRDKKIQWVQSRGFIVRNKVGKPERIVGTLTNITKQKEMEIAIKSSQEKAKRAEERLVEALEVSEQGFSLWDKNDRLVIANDALLDIFPNSKTCFKPGRTFENIMRDILANSKEFIPEQERNNLFKQLLKEHKKPSSSFEKTLSNGIEKRCYWIKERQTKTKDKVTICVDITELKEREKELLKSKETAKKAEHRLVDAIEQLNEPFCLWDKNDRLVLVNKKATQLFTNGKKIYREGRFFKDILREGIESNNYFFHTNEDRENWIRKRIDLHKNPGKVPVKLEYFNGCEKRYILVKETKTRSNDLVSVGVDITELENQAEKLRESEKKLRTIIESVPLPVIIQTIETQKIVFANKPWKKMIYGNNETLYKKGIQNYLTTETFYQFIDILSQKKELNNFEVEFSIPSQKSRSLILSAKVLQFENQESIVIGFHDITEKNQIESELNQAKEQAEFANRAKTEFLANMSHELRTPLNAIIGFSEVIKNQVLGPAERKKYHEYVSDIFDSGNHLLSLINDILDIAKIEAGQLELKDEKLRIEPIIDTVLRMIRERAYNASVTILKDLENDIPEIIADERAMKQILINLLSNSVKFTPVNGEIKISVSIGTTGDLIISVSDTGIGIAKSDIPQVLTNFGQIENALNRKYPGTGLGLPLVKSLIELHGGSLHIESKVNFGTTVSLRFPKKRLAHSSWNTKYIYAERKFKRRNSL